MKTKFLNDCGIKMFSKIFKSVLSYKHLQNVIFNLERFQQRTRVPPAVISLKQGQG